MDVEEHGARSVGCVCDMHFPAGQVPYQPGIHGAKQDLAAQRFFARALHMVEDPFNLGAGKICVRHKAGHAPDMIGQSLPHQLVHNAGRAAALPDDRGINRPTGRFIPENGGLALVGDADAGYLGGGYVGCCQCLQHGGILGGPNLHWLLLDPALVRIMLGQLMLADRQNVLFTVKQNRARTGRALIQCQNILRHLSVASLSCSYHTVMEQGLSILAAAGEKYIA